MPRRDWTREELIVAFNLYCKIPLGRIHIRNPLIIELKSIGEFHGRGCRRVETRLERVRSDREDGREGSMTLNGGVDGPHSVAQRHKS